MGDRRNVVVLGDSGAHVALYTHWGGSDPPHTLAKALDRGRGRWSDPSYLTRIIFCEMLCGEDQWVHVSAMEQALSSETGFGIEPFVDGTTNYCEADWDYDLKVDPAKQQVGTDGTWWSFEQFITDNLPSRR